MVQVDWACHRPSKIGDPIVARNATLMQMALVWLTRCLWASYIITWFAASTIAADQPQWGQRDSRNMVSDEKGLPDRFDPGTRNPKTGEIDLAPGSHVKWVARLGNQSYGSPIVAGGRVLVGTNNEAPRDPHVQGDRGVLMCFDENSGGLLLATDGAQVGGDQVVRLVLHRTNLAADGRG